MYNEWAFGGVCREHVQDMCMLDSRNIIRHHIRMREPNQEKQTYLFYDSARCFCDGC